jgi:hypothetical protein
MFKGRGFRWVLGWWMVVLCLVVVGCGNISPTGGNANEEEKKKLDAFMAYFNVTSSFFLNFGLAVNGVSSEELGVGFPGLEVLVSGAATPTSTVLLSPKLESSNSIRAQALSWQGPTSIPDSIPDPVYYCEVDEKCREDKNWYFVEIPDVPQFGGGDLKRYIRTTPPGNPDDHTDPGSVARLDEVTIVTGEAPATETSPGGTFEVKWDIYMEQNATDSATYDGAYRVTALIVDGVENKSFIELTFTGLVVGEDSISGTFKERVNFRTSAQGTTITIGIGGSSTFTNFGAGGGGNGYLYYPYGGDPGEGGPWATPKTGGLIPLPFSEGILVKFTFDPVSDIEKGGYKVKYETYLKPGEIKTYPPEM